MMAMVWLGVRAFGVLDYGPESLSPNNIELNR
jgi:hypothetical protein